VEHANKHKGKSPRKEKNHKKPAWSGKINLENPLHTSGNGCMEASLDRTSRASPGSNRSNPVSGKERKVIPTRFLKKPQAESIRILKMIELGIKISGPGDLSMNRITFGPLLA
jgi:hypothetical protein